MDETLQWMNTPPEKKTGWYWVYRPQFVAPKLVQVFADEDKLRYSFHETPFSKHDVTPTSFAAWYGPVADPPRKPE